MEHPPAGAEAAGALAGRNGTDVAGSAETGGLERENAALRAQLTALEAELSEVQARANAAIGEWQERVYWLDRWHLDLNALMRRRGAAEFRAFIRLMRSVIRWAKRTRQVLQRS